MKIFIPILLLLFCVQHSIFSQTGKTADNSLVVRSNKQQNNVIISNGNQAAATQISFSQEDIVYNDISNYNPVNHSFEILTDGMYEVSAVFYFNPNRKEKDFVRFGINFLILKNMPRQAARSSIPKYIIAGTRFSFNNENSFLLTKIELPPVIVHLKAGDVIKAYIGAGNLDILIDKGQFASDLGKNIPYSKIIEIKKIEL